MNYDRIALVILDGVGIGKKDKGDMVDKSNMPIFKNMINDKFHLPLYAHGTYVGLASDSDMGNSEVGHNALGSGQIISQGAKLVDEAIKNKLIYNTDTWKNLINNCIHNNSNMHFIGLLSDGNVHSNINHLLDLLTEVKLSNIKNCFIHILLDGRDVPSDSSIKYIDILDSHINKLNDGNFHASIASGGGRMEITMDRYKANWDMVKKGWDTHVHGIGRKFNSAKEAIETYRKEGFDNDQYLPAFVISNNNEPIGKIKNNDSVILFNFRGDRAIEISMAFDDKDFKYFDRGDKPDVMFAGMLEYDGDLKIPKNYLVNPPKISDTLTDVLCKNKIYEYAVSETQKYGHVTYFWNGNRSGKVDEKYEDYFEIESDICPFDEKPSMKCKEIADAMINAIKNKKYNFMRCNFANGDMVGHTGNINATKKSLEDVDIQLGRIKKACEDENVLLIVTADHGNADQMYEYNDKSEIRTAHSLNQVWFIINEDKNKFILNDGVFGLANVAPTILKLFGIKSPDTWEKSIIK